MLEMPVYAHIYNRGVDRRTIFLSDADYSRFILAMRIVALKDTTAVSTLLRMKEKQLIDSLKQRRLKEQFGPPMLDILAFCLMPNHYHIVVRAPDKESISKYAQRLGNSHTRFFNTKNKRKGRLFESSYKTVLVQSDEQLIHLIRYVHTNPANSPRLSIDTEALKSYQWSSFPAYLRGESKMCDIQQAMSFFPTIDDFWEFTKAGIKQAESLSERILIDMNDE